jgi:hypothetical protein
VPPPWAGAEQLRRVGLRLLDRGLDRVGVGADLRLRADGGEPREHRRVVDVEAGLAAAPLDLRVVRSWCGGLDLLGALLRGLPRVGGALSLGASSRRRRPCGRR